MGLVLVESAYAHFQDRPCQFCQSPQNREALVPRTLYLECKLYRALVSQSVRHRLSLCERDEMFDFHNGID